MMQLSEQHKDELILILIEKVAQEPNRIAVSHSVKKKLTQLKGSKSYNEYLKELLKVE